MLFVLKCAEFQTLFSIFVHSIIFDHRNWKIYASVVNVKTVVATTDMTILESLHSCSTTTTITYLLALVVAIKHASRVVNQLFTVSMIFLSFNCV